MGVERESQRNRHREWGSGDKLYSEHCLLPILLFKQFSQEAMAQSWKLDFLPLWSKHSCPILPMSCVLETHLRDNKTAVLKMSQLTFIWQWENIVYFDCNCCQTLQWSFHAYFSKFIFSQLLMVSLASQQPGNTVGKLGVFHVGNVRPRNIDMPQADL